IVGTDPDSLDQPDPSHAGDPSHGPSTPMLSPLAEAITASLRTVARAVAREPVPADPATRAATAKAAADDAEQATTKAAHKVFTVGGPRTGHTTTAGTRPPTAAERTAVRVLARALSTAGIRDRVATKTTSPTPPGRLRMRGALAADAQRAAGALPTAEPFTRITHTPVPTPPLRLGIACDVSGSMQRLAPTIASTAWILAHAAHHTTVPADTATVIFGHHVRPITRPGTAPAQVTEFTANDNYEDIPTAIDALDGALGLSHPGAARLLVIVSDGHFRGDPRHEGQQRIDRLRAAGCGVLWLTTDTTDTPLDGVTVHMLTDPAATVRTIGHAATTALRATH
ncbi:MAG TPA: VWA domain-containing protein, partial [Pseudonocardiaceae bacterium]|nr:VWA domain-containing protein [Pseudonocardiaceae bacterium]